MRCTSLFLLIVVTLITVSTEAADFSFNHVWSASDVAYPTGLGWADFDNNGWPDLYVANGLDVQGRANTIYFNGPDSLAHSAGYFSSDLDPSCQVSIGDLDSDGDPEVVVSSLGYTPLGCPPHVQLIYYHNNGILDDAYSWSYANSNGFSNALGDYDGDGDLDIVFALGDLYTNHPQRSVIFENVDGVISITPAWYQNVATVATDAAFIDIDLDGDLDLAITGDGMSQTIAGAAVYYNNDGIIEAVPSWMSQGIDGGPQLDFGDVDNDGYPELAIANGGLTPGQLCFFKNNGGVLETTPGWSTSSYNSSCCVAWGDLDGDGDLDLIAGSWYKPPSIFINNSGILSDTAVLELSIPGSTQMISLADFDQDYLIDTFKTIICNGSLRLFSLKEKPIHKISSVLLNGTPLGIDQYCYELEKGWVSLGFTPVLNDTLIINYTFSLDLDITISSSGGVYLFENKTKELNFTYPYGLPQLVKRGLQTEIEVVVGSYGSGVPVPATGKFHYSLNGGPYTVVDMEAIGENQYRTYIPAVTDCEDELVYFFSAKEYFGRTSYSTDTAVGHRFTVYTTSEINFEDNFQTNKYWGLSSTATQGIWERGIPLGDGSDGAPTSDFDGSGYCYLTGNMLGVDVDNGSTSIISPDFALSDTTTTFISYARWFNNSCEGTGTDYFRVYISNDYGENWILVEEIVGGDDEAEGGWYTNSFKVDDYLAPTSEMKLMFEVSDLSPESCVEAAVDDIIITSFICSPSCCINETGNVNCDPEEVVDISDITRLIDFLYISHNPLCCPEEADTDGSGGEPDISDITRLIDFLYISHNPLVSCP